MTWIFKEDFNLWTYWTAVIRFCDEISTACSEM